ncbi:hypothetical protein DFH06DRAFT_1150982 [Mycena polygramma]|nr:hypothetical protein DFH06DRAFT_1150982 [Mycena polygramma]
MVNNVSWRNWPSTLPDDPGFNSNFHVNTTGFSLFSVGAIASNAQGSMRLARPNWPSNPPLGSSNNLVFPVGVIAVVAFKSSQIIRSGFVLGVRVWRRACGSEGVRSSGRFAQMLPWILLTWNNLLRQVAVQVRVQPGVEWSKSSVCASDFIAEKASKNGRRTALGFNAFLDLKEESVKDRRGVTVLRTQEAEWPDGSRLVDGLTIPEIPADEARSRDKDSRRPDGHEAILVPHFLIQEGFWLASTPDIFELAPYLDRTSPPNTFEEIEVSRAFGIINSGPSGQWSPDRRGRSREQASPSAISNYGSDRCVLTHCLVTASSALPSAASTDISTLSLTLKLEGDPTSRSFFQPAPLPTQDPTVQKQKQKSLTMLVRCRRDGPLEFGAITTHRTLAKPPESVSSKLAHRKSPEVSFSRSWYYSQSDYGRDAIHASLGNMAGFARSKFQNESSSAPSLTPVSTDPVAAVGHPLGPLLVNLVVHLRVGFCQRASGLGTAPTYPEKWLATDFDQQVDYAWPKVSGARSDAGAGPWLILLRDLTDAARMRSRRSRIRVRGPAAKLKEIRTDATERADGPRRRLGRASCGLVARRAQSVSVNGSLPSYDY